MLMRCGCSQPGSLRWAWCGPVGLAIGENARGGMRKCWRCTPQSFRRFAFQTENVVGNLTLSDFHGAVDGPQVTIADGGTKLTMEPPFNNDQKWVVAAELGPVQCSVRSMPLTWPLTACVAFHQNATKMAGFTMRDARSMDCRDREQLAVRRAPAVRAQLIRSSGPAKVRSKFKSAD